MDSALHSIIAVFSFATGACVASFLNVVVWRVPRGESIVSPPSHCPKCNAPIRWWQNIPILSWLALRGKCAKCREPISPRYIVVEAIGGALFLAAFLCLWLPKVPLWLSVVHLFVMWTWIALMIVGSLIDFGHKLLPDFVTVGGMVLGVAESLVFTCFNLVYGDGVGASTWLSLCPTLFSLSGLAFGFGLLWLVRLLGSKAFKREAMGMGDVFLMGAVGALFGPVAVLVTLILSSLFGSIVGVSMVALSKTKFGKFVEIPYGPYICMGCLVWMFFGQELVRWYIGFMR